MQKATIISSIAVLLQRNAGSRASFRRCNDRTEFSEKTNRSPGNFSFLDMS